MATYKINTDNKTNNLSKLIQQNQAKQNGTASTRPSQTVQIKNPNTGSNMTVTAGSQTHKNYLKNNPSAIDQSSVNTTYSTPDVYKYSDNVKQFDQNGQQTYSVSGYQGATTGYTASSNATALAEKIKQQEALMRQTWATADKAGYNDLVRQRNELTGQLANLLTTESQGNVSLADIEAVLGRRLENQEMQAYREQFSNGSTLQQQQLNNLWEHDFATRNNGEAYQYQLNYLNNGTGGEVLGDTMLNYINNMSPEALANFTQNQANSLASTQNYFTQRADGYVPNYVNNTANPLPWGEVDAADVINDGGVKLQQQYEDYLWMMQQQQLQQQQQLPNLNYPSTDLTNSNMYTPQIPNFNFTMPQTTLNPNINITMPNTQVPIISGTDSAINPYNTSQSSYGATNNQTLVDKNNELLNKYLQDIFQGGI